MEDVIAIILTVLIGIGAKWLENRHKSSGQREPEKGSRTVTRRQEVDHGYKTINVPPAPAPAVKYTTPKPTAKPLFEEGQCAVPHEPVEDAPVTLSQADDEAVAAHFARWRQAIIDAQIITPKFKD